MDKRFNHLTPFKRCVIQNFPFIEADFDALTNYGLLCKIVEYLNKVIASQNEVLGVTQEIVDAFNNLYNYVNNYFENLDVQEEVNKKLDEMVEDGTLQEMIDEYLNVLKETYIINDITFEKGNIDGTDYFIAEVPHLDSEGNAIVLKHGFASDDYTATVSQTEDAREFACRKGATFAVNASIFGIDDSEQNFGHPMGVIIRDGSLVSNYNNNGYTDATKARMRMLGVKEDGSIDTYAFNTTYDTFIADGVVNTFCGYGTAMENSVVTYEFAEEQNIWNFVCQNTTTKDLLFICCNGRKIQDQEGLTPTQLLNIAASKGYDYAFAIDAGGSTCFVNKGIMENMPYDNRGREVRKTPDYIFFGKEPQTNVDYNLMRVTKDASDASIRTVFLKNNLSYLQGINNNYLDFHYPNTIHDTAQYSGVHLRYIKEGEPYKQLMFGTDALPNGFSLYDNENNITIFKADADTKTVQIAGLTFADFFTAAQNITDYNSETKSGIWRVGGNATNKPWTGTVGGICINLAGVSGGTQQIAIPQSADSTTNGWYTRHYNDSNQTWESWKLLVTPTAP